MEKVLTVEEVFSIGKRGVIVTPWIPLSSFDGKTLPKHVELRMPDGTVKTKGAQFSIPRQSPQPDEYFLGCFIKNIARDDCPVGTEIWAKVNFVKN